MVYGGRIGRVQALLMACLLLLVLTPAMAATSSRTLLVLGDSLSAAYGLDAEQGWVALLDARMRQQQPPWRVVNASVSGETTAGGRARIARELQRHQPHLVVIELGANDGLRGLPLAHARDNLDAIIRSSREVGAKVLLIGMRLPPNYGPEYTSGFERNFVELSDAHGVPLLPFLLEPIATDRDAFQADNLHPVAEAQPRLLEHVWSALSPLIHGDGHAEP